MGNFWPILINRDDRGNFYVLDCECRHSSCVVPIFNDTGEYRIRCPCHGSEYYIDGSLLWGPATEPLHKYPFEFDGIDTLKIKIPCWGFKTKITTLPPDKYARVRIDFATFPNVVYEAKSRVVNSSEWSGVQFSRTVDGTLDQTTFIGDGMLASIFVASPVSNSFYAIDMVLSEV